MPDPHQEQVAFGTARGRWVIAASVLGSGIASLDATVVNISLPAIGRSFHAGLGTLQWVVTGYSLTLAAFLLLGGSLGDRHGRRRVFAVGVVWFAAASVALAVAVAVAGVVQLMSCNSCHLSLKTGEVAWLARL